MDAIKICKTSSYTTISTAHFKERGMSLKAKGLLSLMLALPDGWACSVSGLVELSSDGRESVTTALKELERFGYLKRERQMTEDGKFAGYDYTVCEKPFTGKPFTGKPFTEKPFTEKPSTVQQYNNIYNNNNSTTTNSNNSNTNLNTQETNRVLKTTNVDTNNSHTQETKEIYINPLIPTVYAPLLTENHENGEKSGEERPKETIPPSYNPKQKSENNKKTSKQFTPPTLEEVQAYCKERNNNVDAKRFWDYYEAAGWKDQSGKPVKNWKQKMIAVWERPRDENTRYGTTTTTRTRKYGDPDYYGTTDKGYEYL